MEYIWLTLFVLFLAAEGATAALISVWFAGGALAGLIASLLNAPVWLQIALFCVVSGLLLLALRPLSKKWLKPKVSTNVDAVIGTTGKVTVAIDNDSAVGQVKLDGMEWTARSTDGTLIEAGTLVRVDRVQGVKVYVTPVQ